MHSRGQIKPIPKQLHIYQVTVPYAGTSAVSEHEILMEVHPYAALAYLSALEFHQLTNELPKDINALVPKNETVDAYPLGTSDQDWIGLEMVVGRRTPKIHNRLVQWTRIASKRFFGIQQYQPYGYPVRVTTPERTLIDGLQRPELCGGIDNVLHAWAMARESIDVDTIVYYANLFDINVLRQRVGFILEELKISHSALDTWCRTAGRGGSSKLAASEPYSDIYNERWNLSLNVPIAALHETWP